MLVNELTLISENDCIKIDQSEYRIFQNKIANINFTDIIIMNTKVVHIFYATGE